MSVGHYIKPGRACTVCSPPIKRVEPKINLALFPHGVGPHTGHYFGPNSAPTTVYVDGAEFVLPPWARFVRHRRTTSEHPEYDGFCVIIEASKTSDFLRSHTFTVPITITERAVGRSVRCDFSATPDPWSETAPTGRGQRITTTICDEFARIEPSADQAQFRRFIDWAALDYLKSNPFLAVPYWPVEAPKPPANPSRPENATMSKNEKKPAFRATLRVVGSKGSMYEVGPTTFHRDDAGNVVQRVIRILSPSGTRRCVAGSDRVFTPPFVARQSAEESAVRNLLDALLRSESAPTEAAEKPKPAKVGNGQKFAMRVGAKVRLRAGLSVSPAGSALSGKTATVYQTGSYISRPIAYTSDVGDALASNNGFDYIDDLEVIG